jgi:hypothetical protein
LLPPQHKDLSLGGWHGDAGPSAGWWPESAGRVAPAIDQVGRLETVSIVGTAGGFAELLQGKGAQRQSSAAGQPFQSFGHEVGHVADVEGA